MAQENTNFNLKKTLLFGLIATLCIIFVLELFRKTIISGAYYEILARRNRTSEQPVAAARGVFYDRKKQLLVANEIDKQQRKRTYSEPTSTAHLLGYLGLPDSADLKDYSCGRPALLKQQVGKTGLERFFECQLRGQEGRVLYETDASLRRLQELARKEPVEGENINLSIDLTLQKAADKAFEGKKGAVIATDPHTGEVLLYYSSPSFDPNDLSDPKRYTALINNPDQPLFNRLTLATYPPGSIIKPLFALAALEDKVINAETEFEDTGYFELGGLKFGNWYFLQYGKKEGSVDVVKSLSRSNDIFFYQIGSRAALDQMSNWLRVFGYGQQALLPFVRHSVGVIPSSQWKLQTIHEKWYTGDSINLSIGQGYLLVNPIEMHRAMTVIATRGKLCNFTFELGKKTPCIQTRFTDERGYDLVLEGMRATCNTGGTAWPFFDFIFAGKRVDVACKTGTAESQQKNKDPHAWFTMFYPATKPKIALTLVVENGGEGSSVAAPIAKKILETYLISK